MKKIISLTLAILITATSQMSAFADASKSLFGKQTTEYSMVTPKSNRHYIRPSMSM